MALPLYFNSVSPLVWPHLVSHRSDPPIGQSCTCAWELFCLFFHFCISFEFLPLFVHHCITLSMAKRLRIFWRTILHGYRQAERTREVWLGLRENVFRKHIIYIYLLWRFAEVRSIHFDPQRRIRPTQFRGA